ncbi:hypothetical protein AAFF_G00065980 [Aldrovandia affinis]|uniref:Uncharacterized protein n=1 Tax=Aldrovandia affinis TaxID=143900 RepID=A0AAD7WYT7_9TELE|nr:hypothetical protein AAFF_G00065980 [Aldrovandia affinis]
MKMYGVAETPETLTAQTRRAARERISTLLTCGRGMGGKHGGLSGREGDRAAGRRRPSLTDRLERLTPWIRPEPHEDEKDVHHHDNA